MPKAAPKTTTKPRAKGECLATDTKKNRKRTSEAPSVAQRLLRQQRERRAAIAELRRIRKAAADEIERLIDIIDRIDGDFDAEPSLGFLENHPTPPFDSGHWWPFKTSDGRQDIDQGTRDDREGDEHDGREPDEDLEQSIGYDDEPRELDEGDYEPDLGFLECFTGSGRAGNVAYTGDREEDGSYVTEAARQRYRRFDRNVANNDGKHVDVARGYGAYRHIQNLTDRQRERVSPRIDLDSTVRVGG